MLRRLPDALRARADLTPDAIAHDDTTHRLSFAAWDAAATAIGGGLVAAGVAPGDRVLLPISNDSATRMATAFIGVLRAGAIAVPLNVRLSEPEVASYVDLVGSRWAITDQPTLIQSAPLDRVWTVDALPDAPDALPDQGALDAGADADIISTSGTTGRPKGVVFSHADLVEGLDPTASSPSTTLLHALPFTGFGGCHAVMLLPLRLGTTVITQPKFDVPGMLRLIEEKRPVSLQLVPSMLRLLVDHPDAIRCDTSSIRWIFTGTAPLPVDTVNRLEAVWPAVKLINVYGMTEGGGGTQTSGRDSLRKPGSVGRSADPSRIEIRADDGSPLQQGAVGEIWSRLQTRRRYWNDPEATAAAWQDGWVKTGDLGYIDADGDLILVGRSKDLIIRGGYNIAPIEIEDVLHAHEAVLDAAVVGVAHEILGEDVAAAVVRRPGSNVSESELGRWCSERLADNKVPRVIVFVDALPYNQNGKVVKRELKEPLEHAAAIRREART